MGAIAAICFALLAVRDELLPPAHFCNSIRRYSALHAVLFFVVGTFVPWVSSPAGFWFLCRFTLAALSAAAEAFAAAVIFRECRKMNRMACGYLTVAFMATSPGMFRSPSIPYLKTCNL